MSKLNAFVNKLKSSQVEIKPVVEPELVVAPKVEVKRAPNLEVKRQPVKSAYVAKRPHVKTRERNERFIEFIQSDEANALIKDVKNTHRLKILVNAFKEKYNESMPLVTAYSIYNQISK